MVVIFEWRLLLLSLYTSFSLKNNYLYGAKRFLLEELFPGLSAMKKKKIDLCSLRNYLSKFFFFFF